MSDEANQSSEVGSSPLRKIILFGILGVGLIALAYDYAVARPAVDAAYDRIVERATEANRDATTALTNKDIRQLIGRDPASSFQDENNGDLVEVYSWRSGLPIKTHDLYAVYKSNGGKMLFHRHAKFKYEGSGDVTNFSVPQVVSAPPEGYAEGPGGPGGPPDGGGGDGGGAGPGGGGGRPGGGGGNWDPEARFTENDADGDGVWKDDEIPERARENMADIDTDGDDAISKEEWMARVEAMRARFGGGGGSDQQRPPEDEDETSDAEEESSESEDEPDEPDEPAEPAEPAEPPAEN